MAGPIVGQVDMFTNNATASGSTQSLFVNLYRLINDNTGTLGVQRIAYNTGTQDTGMTQFRGMNYHDEPNPAGQHAWAVFRFMSASVPFDMLIQWSGANSFGTAPGSPGVSDGSAITYSIGIAIAQSIDLTSTWNGSTNNNGNDVKGSVVWTSSSVSSTIYYPRSNDLIRAGAFGANRQNTTRISIGSTVSLRSHIIIDYDNLVIAYDTSADNTYNIFFFGKYVPISGANVQIPYFMFNDTSPASSPGTIFGPVAGNTSGGGTSYPSPAISGSVGLSFDRMGSQFMQSALSQPNRAFATPRWDEFPLHLGLTESPIIGLLGQHYDILREVYNLSIHDTNADGTRVVVGGSTSAQTVKFSMPFHSGTTPGAGVTRGGTRFSVP